MDLKISIMDGLEQLINDEERRIDLLMKMRSQVTSADFAAVSPNGCPGGSNLDYDIQKAWEQLTIYKIRRSMGF